MAWPLGASLIFTLLSLIAFGLFGFNWVLLYLFLLSAVASLLFWRESFPARGNDNQEGRGR
jgi:hypothetical protein